MKVQGRIAVLSRSLDSWVCWFSYFFFKVELGGKNRKKEKRRREEKKKKTATTQCEQVKTSEQ